VASTSSTSPAADVSSQHANGELSFDAVVFDAGGVLVLPDPTVLAPLLAPYGGSSDVERHRRAHYAAMAVKSHRADGEYDWAAYDEAYVRSVGVTDDHVEVAAGLLGACRVPDLWRWPIPESLDGLRALVVLGVPLAVVSNASGQIAATLSRVGVCQVGDGGGVAVRCVVDSHVVGVAKPDPAIFDHALAELADIDRSRIVYVGDSVTIDVAGAIAAGLRPVLLDPYDDHAGAPFARIRRIGDLVTSRAEITDRTHATVTER
jgi:putative hydrolase of the HAD superfamily